MVLNSKTSSLAGLLVAAAVLYLAREVLIPLALAILLSFLLAPVVRRLEHWRLGRIPSTIIAVAVGFALIGGIGAVAARQALSLAAKLPEYRENIQKKIRAVRAPQEGRTGDGRRRAHHRRPEEVSSPHARSSCSRTINATLCTPGFSNVSGFTISTAGAKFSRPRSRWDSS